MRSFRNAPAISMPSDYDADHIAAGSPAGASVKGRKTDHILTIKPRRFAAQKGTLK